MLRRNSNYWMSKIDSIDASFINTVRSSTYYIGVQTSKDIELVLINLKLHAFRSH